MARRASIYLSTEAAAALAITEEDSLSGRLNSIVLRYDGIRRESCPAFSEAEWSAIVDVLNGIHLAAEVGELDPARFIWAELADSPEMAEKWGIDLRALVERVRALDYAARVAVAEVATRFWRSPRLNELSTAELLAEAGARIA